MQPRKISLFLLVVLIVGGQVSSVRAQENPERTPIDMMLVIDNSCSMFPRNKILPGCTSWGSDVDFLRIKGADLFFARLGFGEPNERQYQAGVISLGDEPELVSPLTPLKDARDALSKAVADPKPQSATQIVPALKLAYLELSRSPARASGNRPTIVLITDGVPWPQEGQSTKDIERLLQEHPDVPLFIMLLKGGDQALEGYDQYVRFWKQMQITYSNVFAYSIENASQIETTYNEIIARLQNTVPTTGIQVSPQAPLRVYVSEFVRRVIVTVIHPVDKPKAEITVEDYLLNPVEDTQEGVTRFRGEDNPVEIISISPPRLDEYLKQNYWTIKSSEPVQVFIDREGSYQIQFLSPAVRETEVSNVYVAEERQSSGSPLSLRFNLMDDAGQPVRDPQIVRGDVIFPDGSTHALNEVAYLEPDSSGVYDARIDLAAAYPAITTSAGRFTFLLKVGSADERGAGQLPIATSQISVEVGPGAFIQSVDPTRIICDPLSPPPQVSAQLGDFNTLRPGSIKASIVLEGQSATLAAGEDGRLSGDLGDICTTLVSRLECGSQTSGVFELQVSALLLDGGEVQLTRTIPAQVIGQACAARPTGPTAVVIIPTPSPTPIPDTDADGFLDPSDRCPDQVGLSQFNGCPAPAWLLGLLGLLISGFAGFGLLVVWPWVRVRTTGKPPEAYITACKRGRLVIEPVNIREVGTLRRTRKVTIGSDKKKAHIVIEGLKPVEFVVLVQKEKVYLADPKTGALKGTFRALVPDEVPTSNPDITLWVGLNLNMIKRVEC